MNKLYRKGTVHPSPSPSPSLSFLPAAIFTLAAALSTEDKEVLTYLLSCSTATTTLDFNPSKSHHHHNNHHQSPSSTCYCFTCYTTYWARWDSSPNRQLIHEIIDAFEDGLLSHKSKNKKKKKQSMTRREKRNNNNNKGFDDNNRVDGPDRVNTELGRAEPGLEVGGQLGNGEDETGEKQGSMRKLVSFVGERIWGSFWG